MGQTWNGDLLHDAGNVVSDIGGFVAGPPGDPGRIRQIAAHIEHVQHEYDQHARAVNDAVDELLQTWTGTGSAAFRERWHGGGSGQSPAQVLSGAADQLGALAKQLRDYADQLEHAQHEHWIQLAVMGALTVANVVQLGLDPVTDAADVGAAATMEVGTGLALADVGTFAIQGAFAGFASDVVAQLGADVFDHLDGGFDQSGDNAVALLNPGDLVLSTAAGGAGGALFGGALRGFNIGLRSPVRAGVSLNSSRGDFAGIEQASPDLMNSVASRRTVVTVAPGSEEARYLDALSAEANVGGPSMSHILLRENPSQVAVLEEFLHGTQWRLGVIDRLGIDGCEWQVKDFMIRHAGLLGIGQEDVKVLTRARDAGL